MPESSPPTTERILAGRYRLVRPLARGGMAEVWEGHDEVLARPVAVKVLHAHLARDPDFAERFRREAVAAARLAHANIVATFDAGTDGDTAFIVMELVLGQTLRQALEADGCMPAAKVVRIGMEVAEALDCAHRNGLIHRDVKPANILLAGGRVKVADFGIAKLEAEAGGDLTQTGAIIGTAKYLSPEQVEGRPPDARSDVYALGVVLYELMCGKPPFVAETELATAMQHVKGEVVPPRQVVAGVPRPLEAVVLRAMARDPAERYQSAAELRAALSAVDVDGDEEPLFVRDEETPPSGIVPVARGVQRSRVPLVLGAVGVLAAVVLAALLLGSGDDGDPGTTEGPRNPAPVRQVRIASATSFDPQGSDGDENSALARFAIDGNQATDWHSDTYDTRDFGRLKEGVGLILRLDAPTRLAELKALSPVEGWAATVFVADAAGDELEEWGPPVTTQRGIAGNATFDLDDKAGRFVLLWITDPGPSNRAEITDLSLSAS